MGEEPLWCPALLVHWTLCSHRGNVHCALPNVAKSPSNDMSSILVSFGTS